MGAYLSFLGILASAGIFLGRSFLSVLRQRVVVYRLMNIT